MGLKNRQTIAVDSLVEFRVSTAMFDGFGKMPDHSMYVDSADNVQDMGSHRCHASVLLDGISQGKKMFCLGFVL